MVIRKREKRIYRKRIPYGMQNFEDVIKEDCFYVDKTPFIENIEESNMYFFFFRPRRFGKTVMVLNFLSNYIDNDYQIPDNMVESNVRIDYEKVRMLIRHDKSFSHDARIIQQLVTKGYVTGKLVENFPAEQINDPDNFLSLLFYFGMVTINGTYEGATKFVIPNEVVRDQMYTYLLPS